MCEHISYFLIYFNGVHIFSFLQKNKTIFYVLEKNGNYVGETHIFEMAGEKW